MSAKRAEPSLEKTENLVIRVTPKDKELLVKLALKDNVTVSQYVYGTLIMDFLTSGDSEATVYAASRLGNVLKRQIKEKFFESSIDSEVSAKLA